MLLSRPKHFTGPQAVGAQTGAEPSDRPDTPDFIETLDTPFLMAPMAGVSSPPFRVLARRGGAGLVYSEMISAVGLTRGQPATRRLTLILPEERPAALQLFGSDPEIMYKAAILVRQAGADLLDINMGCPVRKVRRQGAGSALLDNPSLAAQVLSAAKEGWGGPVSIKVRLGYNANMLEKFLPPLLAAGPAAVCLHGRTAAQGYGGLADWEAIRELASWCPAPVIGNGDIHSPEEAAARLAESGCRAVMIGRGALADPWIFSRAQALRQGRFMETPGLPERGQALLEQAELSLRLFGPQAAVHFLKVFVMWFSRGQAKAADFRRAVGQANNLEIIVDLSRRYFAGETSF